TAAAYAEAALAIGESRPPLGTVDLGAQVALAARLLARVANEPNAILELIDDREVIVNVAVVRAGKHGAAAHADRPHRVFVLHGPGADVEEMDVLFDVEVAGEPGEVVPVPHLIIHVGLVELARFGPAASAVIV